MVVTLGKEGEELLSGGKKDIKKSSLILSNNIFPPLNSVPSASRERSCGHVGKCDPL